MKANSLGFLHELSKEEGDSICNILYEGQSLLLDNSLTKLKLDYQIYLARCLGRGVKLISEIKPQKTDSNVLLL